MAQNIFEVRKKIKRLKNYTRANRSMSKISSGHIQGMICSSKAEDIRITKMDRT